MQAAYVEAVKPQALFMIKQVIRRTLHAAGLYVHPLRTLPRGLDLFIDLARRWHPRRPGVLFDVGANLGQTTGALHAAFPSATIHVFEPVSTTFATMRRRLMGQSQLHLHQAAVGESDGSCLMEARPNGGSNRLITPGQPMQDLPVESVPMLRLDTFCAHHGVGAIDLLKTDCEGHDLEVLRGASGLLAAGAIDCIYSEVNFRRDGRHGDFFAIEAYLRPLGYDFTALYDYSGWQCDLSREAFANALFTRRSHP